MQSQETVFTKTRVHLPEGFTCRSATLDDIPTTADFLNLFAKHHAGVEDNHVDEMYTEWTSPGYDPETDTLLVFDADENMVGYAEVWDAIDPPVKPWVWVAVHPEHEGVGIGEFLHSFVEKRARRAISRVDEGVRVAMLTGYASTTESMRELALEQGFELTRHYYRMRIDMESPPPEPEWPDGISLKPFNQEKDLKAVYIADKEAFRDHYGFVERDFEQGFSDFQHMTVKKDSHDPTLWFLAMDGDQIAGISLCKKYAGDDKDSGFVSHLAVLKPWRKQGLGLALLLHSFGEFYRRGYRKVSLGVDADNLTGALRLYEKAGMYVHRQFDNFEKLIRAGQDISVQSLE
jgi:mycothiol synthase